MRWSCPISSAREYCEISQNLSLTKVIRPRSSVIPMIADLSSANFNSESSFNKLPYSDSSRLIAFFSPLIILLIIKCRRHLDKLPLALAIGQRQIKYRFQPNSKIKFPLGFSLIYAKANRTPNQMRRISSNGNEAGRGKRAEV